jgi:hypothetical protein
MSNSVTPYDSPNDPDPFNPNATPSSNPAPLPSDLEDPELAMYWTTAPDFTPEASAGTPSTSTTPPGDHQEFAVNLATLRGTENSMLSASSEIVTSYESLKALVATDESWVFGQQATVTTMVNGGGYYDAWSEETEGDPIAPQAVAFANGDGTAANPTQGPHTLRPTSGPCCPGPPSRPRCPGPRADRPAGWTANRPGSASRTGG